MIFSEYFNNQIWNVPEHKDETEQGPVATNVNSTMDINDPRRITTGPQNRTNVMEVGFDPDDPNVLLQGGAITGDEEYDLDLDERPEYDA